MKPLFPLLAALPLLATAQAQQPPPPEEIKGFQFVGFHNPGQGLKPLEQADPATPAIRAWQAKREESYRKTYEALVPSFSGQWIIESGALKALFPDYRFVTTEWNELPLPGNRVLGVACNLRVTLAVDAAGKQVKELSHCGNFEPFGEMLRDAKASLRSPEDAKRIWTAFCELHRMMDWQERPALKIDEKTWHLGNAVVEGSLRFYEVTLDEQGRVTAAQLKSKEGEK